MNACRQAFIRSQRRRGVAMGLDERNRDSDLAAAGLGFGHLLLGDGGVVFRNGLPAALELLLELQSGRASELPTLSAMRHTFR